MQIHEGSEDWERAFGSAVPCRGLCWKQAVGQSSKGLGKWKSRGTESMAIRAWVAMCSAQPSGGEKAGIGEKTGG